MKQNGKLFNCSEKNLSWFDVLDKRSDSRDLERARKVGRKFLQITFFAPSLSTFLALPKFCRNLIMFAKNCAIVARSPKPLSLSQSQSQWHDIFLSVTCRFDSLHQRQTFWLQVNPGISAGVMFRRTDWKASKSSLWIINLYNFCFHFTLEQSQSRI